MEAFCTRDGGTMAQTKLTSMHYNNPVKQTNIVT
jgi:hypothetical protein